MSEGRTVPGTRLQSRCRDGRDVPDAGPDRPRRGLAALAALPPTIPGDASGRPTSIAARASGPAARTSLEAERLGLEGTLDLLLRGRPDAEEVVETLVDVGRVAAERDDSGEQLRGWWLYCMLQGGHPLREKMTLFWHNHFATSLAKVPGPGPDVPPERPAARACPGPVRPAAPGDQPRRGHAGLARFQQQRQGASRTRTTPAS